MSGGSCPLPVAAAGISILNLEQLSTGRNMKPAQQRSPVQMTAALIQAEQVLKTVQQTAVLCVSHKANIRAG